jgi:hypothetical protein
MATQLWLMLPFLLVMLILNMLYLHTRLRFSRRAKIVNLVVSAVCFIAILLLAVNFLSGLRLEIA